MNTKIWYAVEVEIAKVAEAAATAQLWALNTTGFEVSEDASDFVTLRAYFDSAPDVEKLRQNILNNLKLIDLPDFALRRVEASTIADQDWMSEWKKGWEPLVIGQKLVIAPSWKLDQVTVTDRVIIQIDPGMAFGTGTHETTRGCLELLEKHCLRELGALRKEQHWSTCSKELAPINHKYKNSCVRNAKIT